jgi:hypothetical protein
MRLPRLFRFDASAWPREQFAAVLCALLLASAWMVATAVREHADVRSRYFVGQAKWSAVSPIPYRSDLAAAARAAGAVPGAPLRLIIRADSAGDALCGLVRAEGALGVPVSWLALGEGDPACAPSVGVIHIRGALADTARAQLRDARWALLDADSRALYSRRDAPDPEQIRALASLLAPTGTFAAAEKGSAVIAQGERP